ncbi:MAG TPA: thiamine pyrophosphate-dependent enzyme, partial [bacterium]
IEDAVRMLQEANQAAKDGRAKVPFDYYGANPGDENYSPEQVTKPVTEEDASPGILSVAVNPETGKVEVKGFSGRESTRMPKRIAPGHGACPGCGIFPTVDQFLKGLTGHVVVLFHTGCGMVVTTGYPYSSHRITYIHNLFQNGAGVMSGVSEMFEERKRRGEIPPDEEITFVMVTGDGGNDIGMGVTIGAALRNNKMIVLEYDNEGYMNTGHQLSFTTPYGHATSTSNVGTKQFGKNTHHKDTAQILAGCHVSYVFTAAESHYQDMVKKAAKAQHYAKKGFVFGKTLSSCPLNWRCEEKTAFRVVEKAVDSCFFPLYEVENGKTNITYNPEARDKKVPVSEWLKMMGKTRHLIKSEYKEVIDSIQSEVDRRWKRLKAMHESSVL